MNTNEKTTLESAQEAHHEDDLEKYCNGLLGDRTITSVERDRTPGWLALHLTKTAEETRKAPDIGLFLTVYVGGTKGDESDCHYSTCSLHHRHPDGGAYVMPLRDDRDPNMPMSRAWEARFHKDEDAAALQTATAARGVRGMPSFLKSALSTSS